jgi:hypothetical protein
MKKLLPRRRPTTAEWAAIATAIQNNSQYRFVIKTQAPQMGRAVFLMCRRARDHSHRNMPAESKLC